MRLRIILPVAFFITVVAIPDALAVTICDAGYFCDPLNWFQPKLCTPGNYCPRNSLHPKPCPLGTYSSASGLRVKSECMPCLAGCYCTGIGSTEPTGVCPKGNYCPKNSYSPKPCPVSTYMPYEGAADCQLCPAGLFCDAPGLANPTGYCRAGYYCPPGSSRPQMCPNGHYCPAGAGSPIPCSSGSYGDVVGQANCKVCPRGFYCPVGCVKPVPNPTQKPRRRITRRPSTPRRRVTPRG